jgi:uncharacterized repeat protein (TIGR01451 family)
MAGRYLLADYCTGYLWDLARTDAGWQATKHTGKASFGIVAFGEDAAGELYVANISQGVIYQVQETSTVPYLSIDKQAPRRFDLPGEPITYTLTVANGGNVPASRLVVTDRIPAGATYLPGSGGTRVGDVISWTFPTLASGGSLSTTFAVTASDTIVNDDYRVTADGGYSALGRAVTTIFARARLHLPVVLRQH